MARPRNEQQRRRIERAAWGLFLQDGYVRTSYSAIAKACGLSRDLVHHYFPHKEELAASLKEAVLPASIAAVNGAGLAPGGGFPFMYAVGCVAFEFFASTEGTRRFLMDLLCDRELTERAAVFNARWALGQVGEGGQAGDDRRDGNEGDPHGPGDEQATAESRQAVERSVIRSINGFSGLFYHCLRNDEPFDVEAETRVLISEVAKAAGDEGALDGYPADPTAFAGEVRGLAAGIGAAVLEDSPATG